MDTMILCAFEDRSLGQMAVSRLSALFEFSFSQLPEGTILLECRPQDCSSLMDRLALLGAAWVKIA